MRLAILALAGALLASCASAQNASLPHLPARGSVAGTDALACQASGSSVLQQCSASALALYAQGAGNPVVGSSVQASGQIYPGTGSATQSGGGILAGTGAPGAGVGADGDFYLRTDCTAGFFTCVFHRQGGSWRSLI
ncbi:MAG TPA: hypothetical protein VG248_02770 [Caulobacteraceae bacterium]|nr:hypothetical protein [Caulobacteraceae bacterium]